MPRKRKELTGQRFGKLTALRYVGYGIKGNSRQSLWECQCDCGESCIIPAYLLTSGRRKSCGCSRTSAEKLAGLRFGRLTVLGEDTENTRTLRKVICRCECGREKSIAFRDLKNGKVTSCGCDRVKRSAWEAFFQRQYNEEQEKKRKAFRRGDLSGIRTLDDWVYIWIQEVAASVVKETTCVMYGETMERHILPSLGEKQLSGLTAEEIRAWVDGLRSRKLPGTIQGYMTEGTVRNTLSVLSGCLRDAQKYGLLEKNPCQETFWKSTDKTVREKKDWLDEEQISGLEPFLTQYRDENGYPAGIGFQLVLYTGMTLSEAAALRWREVDQERGTIHIHYFYVERRLSDSPEEGMEDYLEEVSGRRKREIPAPDFLMKRLCAVREAYGGTEDTFVLSGSSREPAHMNRLRAALSRHTESMGLGRITPRMLRDTYAIRAVRAGATSDMIAELMGFASTQQVLRRYMPQLTLDKRDFVNQMYQDSHL